MAYESLSKWDAHPCINSKILLISPNRGMFENVIWKVMTG